MLYQDSMRREQGLTPTEFFEREFAGGTMADAARGTGRSYQTVWSIRHGSGANAETARRLEAWSRTVESAKAAGVYISAARTLGIEVEHPKQGAA